MKAFTEILKENLGGQTNCCRVRVSTYFSKRMMHEAKKVKTKVEWKPQELRDVSDVNYLPRKAAYCRDNQAKRDPMFITTSKVKVVRLSKLFGKHTT